MSETRWPHTCYDAEKIGRRIRSMRKTRKLSQQELARTAEIDRSYMGRIERGEVNLTLEKLYRFAQVMDCPIEMLMIQTPRHKDPDERAVHNDSRPDQSRIMEHPST